MTKSPEAFRTISEVADLLDVPAHVLRFWETRFTQVKPVKRGGGRRYYRPDDVRLLRGIQKLLYDDGLTIKGVQKILREQGVRHVIGLGTVDEGVPRAKPPAPARPDPRPAPALLVTGGGSPRQDDLLADIVAAVAHGDKRAARPGSEGAKMSEAADQEPDDAGAVDVDAAPAVSIDREALRRLVEELEALRGVMVGRKDA